MANVKIIFENVTLVFALNLDKEYRTEKKAYRSIFD